jgi:hypothetical protein
MEVLKDKCASLFALLPLWALPVRWMWQGADTQIAAIPEAIRRAA